MNSAAMESNEFINIVRIQTSASDVRRRAVRKEVVRGYAVLAPAIYLKSPIF